METLINSELQDKGNVYDNVSDLIGGHGLLSLNGNRMDFRLPIATILYTLVTYTGNAWKTRRKMLNHTVQHYSILNGYSGIFDEKIKTLIEILKDKVGQTFNIYENIESATAEIVCSKSRTYVNVFQNDRYEFYFFFVLVTFCRHNFRCKS